ncbi:hypothetical protein M9458_036321, partial [Cirrhinus mrigala]
MLRRQEEMENGTAWSNSSESSDDSSSPQLSLGMRHAHKNLVQPEVQAAPPAIEISFAPRESATSTPTRLANQKEEDEEEEEEEDLKKPTAIITVTTEAPVKQEVPNGHPRYSRSLSHISENSADGVLTDRLAGESTEASEVTSVVSSVFVSDIATDMPHRAELCFVIPDTQEICPVPDPCTSEPSCPAEPPNCSETCDSEKATELTSTPTCGDKDSLPIANALSQQMDTEAPRTDSSIEPHLTKTQTDDLLATKSGSLVDIRPVGGLEGQSADSGLEEALGAVLGQFPELQ